MPESLRAKQWKYYCGFWKHTCFRCICAVVFLALMIWSTRIYHQEKVFIDHGSDGKKVGFNQAIVDNDQQEVDLRIIVITFNRAESLKRLLNSLNKAEYDNDLVVLEIWIDRFKSNEVHNRTVQTATEFVFLKGESKVHIHPAHVGLRGQWLTTWKPPKSKEEVAVIFEDDLTVSPYFYRYLKLVRRKYKNRPDIAGFALQGTSVRHSDGKCCLNVPDENKVFLYPTVGTWGYSPTNNKWFQFIDWYQSNLKNNITAPLPENTVVSEWYKSLTKQGREDSMWEQLYTFYTDKHNQWTLYSNFAGHRGLAFNWLEGGLHFSDKDRRTQAEENDNLLQEWTLKLTDLPDDPVYVDNSGKIVR